ncbi:hypothetical protein F66182_3536 [Fusarium sp. NRRL 66182]|nr:hypothetical protein F66182_3536 [Fusarium sp. NRRL 66182]
MSRTMITTAGIVEAIYQRRRGESKTRFNARRHRQDNSLSHHGPLIEYDLKFCVKRLVTSSSLENGPDESTLVVHGYGRRDTEEKDTWVVHFAVHSIENLRGYMPEMPAVPGWDSDMEALVQAVDAVERYAACEPKLKTAVIILLSNHLLSSMIKIETARTSNFGETAASREPLLTLQKTYDKLGFLHRTKNLTVQLWLDEQDTSLLPRGTKA